MALLSPVQETPPGRLARIRQAVYTPCTLPLLIFWLSAIPSALAAYDSNAAWQKFAVIGVGVAVFWLSLLLLRFRRTRTWYAGTLVALTCLFAAYYLLQSGSMGKFRPTRVLSRIINSLIPALGLHIPHPNIAAGVFELGLALAICCGIWLATDRKARIAWGLVSLALAFTFFLTESRGGWAAMGLSAVPGVLLVWRTWFAKRANRATFYALCGGIALVVVVGMAFLVRSEIRIQHDVPRLLLYQTSPQLVSDYPFTGYGLDLFRSVYYHEIDMHGPNLLDHTHDLYLALIEEEGIPGFAALLFLGLACVRQIVRGYRAWESLTGAERAFFVTGAWGVGIIALHGTIDNVHYSAKSFPVAFACLACLFVPALPRVARRRIPPLVYAGAAVVMVGAAVLLWRPAAALWYANLGAIAHNRADMPLDANNLPVERADSAALREEAIRDYAQSWALWPTAGVARRYPMALLQQGRVNEALTFAATNSTSIAWLPQIGAYFTHAAPNPDIARTVDEMALRLSPEGPALDAARQREADRSHT